MGRAIFFRAALITLSVIGGICFADGLLGWAALLWTLDGVLVFAFFPLVEGDPVLRRGRLAADVLPVLFFISASALVLLSRGALPGYSFLVLAGALVVQCLAVLGLLYMRRAG